VTVLADLLGADEFVGLIEPAVREAVSALLILRNSATGTPPSDRC
jgi:hypothetical protein